MIKETKFERNTKAALWADYLPRQIRESIQGVDFIERWFESFAKKNGRASLKKFYGAKSTPRTS